MSGRRTGADISQRRSGDLLDQVLHDSPGKVGEGDIVRCAGRPCDPAAAAGPSHDAAWSHSGEATTCRPGRAEVPSARGRVRPTTVRSMISSYESAVRDQAWFWLDVVPRRAAQGLAPRPVHGKFAHRLGQPGQPVRCPSGCLRTTESG